MVIFFPEFNVLISLLNEFLILNAISCPCFSISMISSTVIVMHSISSLSSRLPSTLVFSISVRLLMPNSFLRLSECPINASSISLISLISASLSFNMFSTESRRSSPNASFCFLDNLLAYKHIILFIRQCHHFIYYSLLLHLSPPV